MGSDRITKALLIAIAVGVWLNLWMTATWLADIQSDLIVIRQWTLSGAPVTPQR
jgi:hypothetical protein